MHMYVFWGDIPSSFIRKGDAFKYGYPEIKRNGGSYGGFPIHPNDIQKSIQDHIRNLYENGIRTVYVTTYSELVIDTIRLLSLKALLKYDDVRFPLHDQITFIIPDENGVGFYEKYIDRRSIMDSWPIGFCDQHSKVMDLLLQYSGDIKDENSNA